MTKRVWYDQSFAFAFPIAFPLFFSFSTASDWKCAPAFVRQASMQEYCELREGCRRAQLLRHFGERRVPCSGCDLCTPAPDGY